MSEIMDDISYLSQEIGPRPAGTEEEQQAALYIADQVQKRTGFTANIEDFNTATQQGLVECICFGVAALISLLAIIFSALAVPAFLITLACAILYAFEIIDRPLLSRVFERGVSQNVVARYQPGVLEHARGRKIILVANYDSGKVQSELNGGMFKAYPQLIKASTASLVVLPVVWLFRMLFSSGALIFNVIAAIALVLALIPVAIFLMHKASTYNEAANNNAAGVATMLKVADIIAEGTLSEEELAAMEATRAHSAEEAYAAGVVPEGAELEYAPGVEQTEEERLASAKAAVAALTGQPLREYQAEQIDFTPLAERDDIESYNENMDYGEYAYSEDDELTAQLPVVEAAVAQPVIEAALSEEAAAEVAVAEAAAEAVSESVAAEMSEVGEALAEAAAETPEGVFEASVPTFVPAPEPAPATNEPEWYTTGRAKAVKSADLDTTPIRRSRYADALDAALSTSREHIDQAARMLDEGTIERISQMQRDIEAKNAVVHAFDGEPLQNMLSDEVKEAEEEAAVEATPVVELETEEEIEAVDTAQDEAQVEVEAAESDAAPSMVEVAEEVSDDTVQAAEETEAEEEVEAEVEAKAEAAAEAPAETEEVVDGATISMPPINVFAINEEAEEEPDISEPERDFSQIGAPARRYRDILAPAIDEIDDEGEAPARYGNPLQSERIPRISAQTPSEPISVMEEIKVPEGTEPVKEESIEDKRAALRNAIPSLSGEFAPVVVEASDEDNNEVSKTGSFATASAAVPFEPVGDELVAGLKPEERYVDDADDSSFEENTTETGAYAGPGYVDMPESRLSRFFNRFRKKPEVEEESTAEWLDVDENFSAREVGTARGSWESFRQDAEDVVEKAKEAAEDVVEEVKEDLKEVAEGAQESLFDEYEYVDVDEEERNWHGGAFSQMRARLMRDSDTEEAAAELLEETEGDAPEEDIEATGVIEHRDAVLVPLVDMTEDDRIAEEAKMVYSFRNPDVNTEVWFVALGAEYAGNNGMKAFLAEHAADMRGAIIINLEAMGAGELSFIEEEGYLFTQKPSSRLKRYLHKATEITGIPTSKARISWRESAASLAMKRGLQAMTLAGIEGGKQALLGQGDDVLENIDEEMIAENAQFIIELIKNV